MIAREPYRLFFPLGALLAWAGVLHWLLHAAGLLADYKPVFHSIVQIQGFMMCFAAGFLFTAIPRRTGTSPPSAWQLSIGLASPIGTTVAAWYERWAISQAFWLALVVTLAVFAVRRFLSAGAARRPPNSFVWVPLSLAIGIAGSVLIAIGSSRGGVSFWMHDLGRLMLLQGMFVGLVLGVGGMVLPLITRGDAPPDAALAGRDHLVRAGHVAAAGLLAASFWIENSGRAQAGFALRAAVALIVLLLAARIWRFPSVPGTHRKWVWTSAWMIPVGYALSALFPVRSVAGLHMVFIGGFALMALSVGVHVALAHGGHEEQVRAVSWRARTYGALVLAAALLRGAAEFDRSRFFFWLGASAAVFLAGTIAWGTLLLPALKDRRPG